MVGFLAVWTHTCDRLSHWFDEFLSYALSLVRHALWSVQYKPRSPTWMPDIRPRGVKCIPASTLGVPLVGVGSLNGGPVRTHRGKSNSTLEGQAKITVKKRRMRESSATIYGVFDRDLGLDSQEWSCSQCGPRWKTSACPRAWRPDGRHSLVLSATRVPLQRAVSVHRVALLSSDP